MRAPKRPAPATSTHDGSGGCPTLWGDSFEDNYAFGIIILFFLCSRQKSTVLNVPPTLWRVPAKAKELIFQKTLSADVRREHFSTVGGLHGVRPPKAKNLFFKIASRRRSASTLLHRRWPSRRAPAKAKEFIHKKAVPAGLPARTAKNILVSQHTCICNSPHPLTGTSASPPKKILNKKTILYNHPSFCIIRSLSWNS